MAQIYDRFQIDNGHLFAQLIADTLLTRSFKALNRTVVNGIIWTIIQDAIPKLLPELRTLLSTTNEDSV